MNPSDAHEMHSFPIPHPVEQCSTTYCGEGRQDAPLFPVGKAPTEPSSDARTFARNMHGLYIALTLEGFTENQAMQIIGTTIAASTMRGDN
jgi:hypothetical protein